MTIKHPSYPVAFNPPPRRGRRQLPLLAGAQELVLSVPWIMKTRVALICLKAVFNTSRKIHTGGSPWHKVRCRQRVKHKVALQAVL